MSKARENQYKTTDQALEASILKKIFPLKIESFKGIVDSFDSFLKKVEGQFTIEDEEFIQKWGKYGNGNHIQFYKENGMWAFSIELLTLVGRKDLVKKIKVSRFQFIIDIAMNQVKASTPAQEAEAKKNLTEENAFKMKALYRAGMLDSYCQLFCEKSMFTILKEAISGNDESLFIAISIDKNLMSDAIISQRIQQETLRSNQKFLKSLSEALATPLTLPLAPSRLKMFCFLALSIIFKQLRDSTDEELAYLLKRLDIYEITPDTLRVNRSRLGLVKSKRVPVDYDKMLQVLPPICNKNTTPETP